MTSFMRSDNESHASYEDALAALDALSVEYEEAVADLGEQFPNIDRLPAVLSSTALPLPTFLADQGYAEVFAPLEADPFSDYSDG